MKYLNISVPNRVAQARRLLRRCNIGLTPTIHGGQPLRVAFAADRLRRIDHAVFWFFVSP